jgi:lipopolysaccharide/colanic/teichoic acid biosynthesis glycosyltransferase
VAESTIRRAFDIAVAACALCAALPLMLVAAVGIKLTSDGPILYRARRVGRDRRRSVDTDGDGSARLDRRRSHYCGHEFTLFKFRTMHVSAPDGCVITARNDARIFPFGAWLRTTKIDELPQLLNVLRGEMALVGPRPEAPEIVRQYYTQDDLQTLQVKPGLTSPGTLYYYTHAEALLPDDAPLDVYVRRLLPLKLSLDRVYLKRASVLYDLRILTRTIVVIIARMFGRERFNDPPELAIREAQSPEVDWQR